MTQPATAARHASAPGREAPVAYREIRPKFQRARLAGALAFLVMGIAMFVGGESENPIPMIAAGLASGDAVVRIFRDHRPIWSFLVDAVTVAVIVAIDGGGLIAPLAAVLAYLLVGSILLVPYPGTIWVMVVAGATFSVTALDRGGLANMGDLESGRALVIWGQISVLLTAVGVLLLGAAALIRRARRDQAVALDAERRAGEMKTEFVSMISHELRTPLTNITGFAETLGETWRTLEPAEIDEFIGIIATEAEHLGNIVDNVLAIPRLETGRLLVDVTDFSLRPLAFRIADLVFPAGGEKKASVQVAGNVVLRADPNRVEQVLRNLLDNARKYGGDRVGIESHARGDAHVVVVADNGHGVPEEDRTRIFEQFEQVSRGDTRTDTGVGLGLSITKRLIEAMGGEVWYEPGFPVGARFCFSLPAGAADSAAAEPRRPGERVTA
ncbi:MAG: HAMP domain-containing histidine kinase [Actinobacteria bacterium]|nr:HAMP domain-containing histidine kinase [Actinomycetota bacterium]